MENFMPREIETLLRGTQQVCGMSKLDLRAGLAT